MASQRELADAHHEDSVLRFNTVVPSGQLREISLTTTE